MKNMILICFFIVLGLVSCTRSEEKQQASIAILTPVTHKSLEQIERGFKETIEARYPGKYRFVTYNAQGNKTLMRSEVEEMAQKNYALVLTIGTLASQMATEVFNKKQIPTPIVFTCVHDPIGFGIVSEARTPGGHVTGIQEVLCFEEELKALLTYKPEVKTLLLVYNPMQPGMQKDRQEIENILENKKIALQTVEVFQTNEMLTKVSPFMSSADAMIILKDNTVVTGLDVLVKLCERYHIPLMASDLDSPDRGTAFGYGVYEVDFGKEAAKKALQILIEGIQPGSISVTAVSGFTLRVNSEAAKRQGVILP